MGLIISDLSLNNSTQEIKEITPWEMKNIQGGYGRRRRSNTTVDTQELARLFNEIDEQIDTMRLEVDNITSSLRQQLNL